MMPTISFNIERWKWNSRYKVYVSTEGRFRRDNGEDIKLKVNKRGYLLCDNRFAHRVVLETWKPCENMGNLTVDHLNHNKRDNSLKNLEWVSAEENQRRAREDYYNPKDEEKIEKYYVEGIEFSRAQMKILFTEAVFEKLKHKQKRKYCGKKVEVRYEYI